MSSSKPKEDKMEDLPKLPVPSIPRTLHRYLDAVKAVVSKEEYEVTAKKVEAFLKEVKLAEDVGQFLSERSEKEENWAYEYWLNDMYLTNPIALPVNSNPGWVFPRRIFNAGREQTRFLAKLCKRVFEYKEKIESEPLPAEFAGSRTPGRKQPLCMSQYYRVLNTYRRPGSKRDDQLVTDGRAKREQERIMVMIKARIFILPVKRDGKWLDETGLIEALESIQRRSDELETLPLEQRVPLLTSNDRQIWHDHRTILAGAAASNAAHLSNIESCLLTVCMDDWTQNPSDPDRSQASMFQQMLTGHGPFSNGDNRWFDQTVQLISSMDGVNGMCYEHSVSEGIAVVSVFQKIMQELAAQEAAEAEAESESESEVEAGQTGSDAVQQRSLGEMGIEMVEWTLTEELETCIREAAEEFKRLDDRTDVEVFDFSSYGKSFMKGVKCSPDAFVQMALQLAYYSVHGKLCFTYESASTRRFRLGRVDCIRASHPEALKWAEAMANNDKNGRDVEGKLALFKKAISKQTEVMLDNIHGEGLDVPLLGIREALRSLDRLQQVELFEDDVYRRSLAFQLSTSQVPISLAGSYMGYGAVVPDGYGVSYNLQNDHIVFCVASFSSEEKTSSLQFCQALQKSLDRTRQMFEDK